jgi:XTP/dITP diphosphohydrolase
VRLGFVTENAGKLAEARAVLSPLGIEVHHTPLPLSEPKEGTIREICLEKLHQVRRMGMDRVMVDDAGIFLASYPGFPGVLTKRIFEMIGYKGFMNLLAGQSRQAWFEGAVAALWDGEIGCFVARTPGRIIEADPESLRPEPGFPFNPIFVPEGEDRVLSKISREERLKYSYRRKAMEQLAGWLKERMKRDRKN